MLVVWTWSVAKTEPTELDEFGCSYSSLVLDISMKNPGLLVAGIAVVAAYSMTTANDAAAQCATCPTPVAAYSPVVYNTYQTTYDDGWYLGKFVGRLGRRIFGTAPAPAANYTAAYPMTYAAAYPAYATAYAPAAVTPTYAASYAPTYAAAYAPSYAASYAPAASACCNQTTYRPVVMQPVVEQAVCYAAPSCPTCEGVVTTSYNAAPASNCPTCSANYGSPVVQQQQQQQPPASYEYSQPAAGPSPTTSAGPAPPRTFQDQPPQLEPTPAAGASTGDAASNWEPPQLFAPGDKQVKRPTTTVWNAVYEQPVRQAGPATQSVSRAQATAATPAKRPTITWVSGE
jgi:hypothetical protein